MKMKALLSRSIIIRNSSSASLVRRVAVSNTNHRFHKNGAERLVSCTTLRHGMQSLSRRPSQHWNPINPGTGSPYLFDYRHNLLSSRFPLNHSVHKRHSLAHRSYIVLPSNFQELLSLTSDALNYYLLGQEKKTIDKHHERAAARTKNRLLLLKTTFKQRAALNYKYANATLRKAIAVAAQSSTISKSVTSPSLAHASPITRRHTLRLRRRRVLKMFGDKLAHYKGRLRRSLRNSYNTRSTSSLYYPQLQQNTFVPPTTALEESTTKVIFTRRAKRFLRRYMANGTGASLRRDLESVLWNSPTLLRRFSQGNGLDGVRLVELTDINDGCRFDAEGYPLVSCAPNYTLSVLGGEDHRSPARYINPWSASSCEHEPLTKYARWQLHRLFNCKDIVPKDHGHYLARTNPYMTKLTTKDLPSSATLDSNRIGFTWIGHSTCLVQMHGFAILTDPVFSNVVGPMAPLLGDRRYVQPSHTVEDLGDTTNGPLKGHNGVIDMVCISHDHYDHLDYSSIYQLVKSDKVHVKKWCVPLGTKKWLLDNFGMEGRGTEDVNVIQEDDVIECSWWDDYTITKTEDSADTTIKQLKVTCAPAQHWCARTPFDRNTRLWASFAFEATEARKGDDDSQQNRLAFYFGGDTGFPDNEFPLFSQIGDRLGPFDLSALPIGAYLPNHYIGDSHIGPREALQIADDLRSRQSVAIHWGTFPMGDEPFYDPVRRAHLATEDCRDSNKFLLVRQGEHFLTKSEVS